MPGPPPKRTRVNRSVPAYGDWEAATAVGWQHGATPKPPPGLTAASKTAWSTWMRAWFASNWIPANLPQLRRAIVIHDAVERGDSKLTTELRNWMDGLGITPIGQQRLRWLPPKEDARPATKPKTTSYRRLRAVDE